MKRSLAVVATFVVLNAVGFVAYRASYAPDAAASRLPTSKRETADTLSRQSGSSQAKVATPSVAAPTTSEPVANSEQSSVVEHTNSPTADVPVSTHEGTVQHTRVKQPVRKRVEETPVKVVAKPAADDKAVESKPVADAKSTVETKPAADKAKDKDKVLEMEANPYKRGE